MAARKKIFHDENTRAKIQTTQIIKRLQKHIDAKPEIEDGVVINKELMTQSQVTAALGLIKKTLPDLSAIEYKGEVVFKDASELTDEAILARIGELEGRRNPAQGDIEAKDSKKVTH